jgi:metal-responsive CopG/Arc/MetJ family transcriptional regulator
MAGSASVSRRESAPRSQVTVARTGWLGISIVKTAVSIPEDVFERAETLARALRTSRSRLYALAIEEYVRRHEEQSLVERINAACGDPQTEERIVALQRRLHLEAIEGEW